MELVEDGVEEEFEVSVGLSAIVNIKAKKDYGSLMKGNLENGGFPSQVFLS